MPPDYGGAAKRPVRKTWGKPKKTKENNLLTFQWKVEQKKTLFPDKKSRKTVFSCFVLFL